MRSSTLSTSKSNTSKFKFKQSVVCPINQKNTKTNQPTTSNKKRKNINEPSLEGINHIKGQIKLIPFVTYKNKQLFTNQSALTFLSANSNNLQIQFTGCLGDIDFCCDFFEGVSQLAQIKFTNLDRKQNTSGIFLYNFSLKKKHKIHYFIQLMAEDIQENQQMLYILSIMTSQFLLFISQTQRKRKYLEILLPLLTKTNDSLKDETFGLHFPKICCMINKDKIIIRQNTLTNYQQLFQSLILNSIKSPSINLTGSKVLQQHSKSKIHQIIQNLLENQQTKVNKNYVFVAKHLPYILQYACKKMNNQQLEIKTIINHQQKIIPFLIKSIYDNKLSSIKGQYQQFFNQLNFDVIDSLDELLFILQAKQQKTLSDFNYENINGFYHRLYQDQLLMHIQELQSKIISNYQQFLQQEQQQNEDNDSQEEGDQKEVDSPTALLNQVQILKNKYKAGQSQQDLFIVQKVLILARNAARLKILGYDQKMKVTELRQDIDQKWRQYQLVLDQKQRKYQQPTQTNLQRQKYKMMSQKICSLQAKAAFLKHQIEFTNNILQLQSRQYQLKQKQRQQLIKIQEKQQILITFIANSSVENPLIHKIQSQIQSINQKNAQASLKKQLILQSLNSQEPLKF